MSLFDGNNPDSDAAAIGGIAGFVEESIREEESILNEDHTEDINLDDYVTDEVMSDNRLRAFRYNSPELFEFIAKKVIEHKKFAIEMKEIEKKHKKAEEEFWYEMLYID